MTGARRPPRPTFGGPPGRRGVAARWLAGA